LKRTAEALLIFAGLCLAGASAFAAAQEATVYLRGNGTVVQRAMALFDDPSSGLSNTSKMLTLADCDAALDSLRTLEMRYQPEERQKAVPALCRTIASDVAASVPTMGYAWFVGAKAALAAGDIDAFNRYFVVSAALSPTELNLALTRVHIAENNLALLDETARAAEDNDLRLLVRSGLGVRNVAARYVADVNFRQRIADIVEEMPVPIQQRFLDRLNSAVRNAGL
jgi:hypothetical protein